ncbi:MAG: ribonuclease Z [Acidimicrobiales bacterium]
MVRELVVLGTASQVPTRHRNHNGYLLRWDAAGILFDPGEGTQRQLLLAGIPSSAVTCICLTHFHGDHCLGLPGVLQRMALDGVTRPVTVAFPAAGAAYFERLRHASVFEDRLDVRPLPVAPPPDGSTVHVLTEPESSLTVRAASLAHATPAVGWRVEEDDGRTMLPSRLAAAGVAGPAVGRLQRGGEVEVDGRAVRLEQVSVERRGQRAAIVMDTGWCEGARSLAAGADLLVCEATFAQSEEDLAARAGHLTAGQAGELANEAGARRLVLTHFSQRYRDMRPLLAEARRAFAGDLVVAEDLRRVPVPGRQVAG